MSNSLINMDDSMSYATEKAFNLENQLVETFDATEDRLYRSHLLGQWSLFGTLLAIDPDGFSSAPQLCALLGGMMIRGMHSTLCNPKLGINQNLGSSFRLLNLTALPLFLGTSVGAYLRMEYGLHQEMSVAEIREEKLTQLGIVGSTFAYASAVASMYVRDLRSAIHGKRDDD